MNYGLQYRNCRNTSKKKEGETLFKIGKKECQRLKNHQNFTILDERERSVQAAEKIKVMQV